MHVSISALLTLGLALVATAAPNPGRTRTRTKTRTRTPPPATATATTTTTPATSTTTSTTSPTSTFTVETCSPGNEFGFEIQCNAYVTNGNYSNDSNSLTRQAVSIASCIDICYLTPNCCGGNFNVFDVEVQGVPGCTMLLKPFSDASCEPVTSYDFATGASANNNVAFFMP